MFLLEGKGLWWQRNGTSHHFHSKSVSKENLGLDRSVEIGITHTNPIVLIPGDCNTRRLMVFDAHLDYSGTGFPTTSNNAHLTI